MSVVSAAGHAVKTELNLGRLLERNPHLQVARDEYNINVTSNEGERLDPGTLVDRMRAFPGAGKATHLYMHLPLCNYICHFCNYVKKLVPSGREKSATLQWADFLTEESRRYLATLDWLPEARVESFYIGGGTAALLLNSRETIEPLVRHVRENYQLTDSCEFNIEGNPDNFTRGNLDLAVELGFNRFSIGVQSLQEEVNDFTKRRHSVAQSIEAIEALLATGHPFNVDMMFGLPYQSVESVRADMRTLVGMGVPTITIYRLRNADREAMGIGNRAVWNIPSVRERLTQEGYFPKLEETYEMRQAVVEVLLDAEYHPSPCGWWSRPGTYPNGNIPQTSKNKWENYHSMIAYGPGAYGWLTGTEEEFLQTHNDLDITRYAEFMRDQPGLPLAYGRLLTGHKAIGAALGFNFKANQPIRLARYQEQFGADLMTMEPFASAFEELLERGLAEMVDGNSAIRPTLDGEALHEEIIYHYFHQRIGLSGAPVCHR